MDGNGNNLAAQRPELVSDSLPQERPGWIEMATSSDHKDVGRVYIGAALSFLALGLLQFLLIRLQLAVPENTMIEPVTFNRLLSVMSASLVVLFAVPLAIGLFTYIVPLQIGARSLAFPKLAQLSAWLYIFGGAALYVCFVYTPPESGFNALPPLSDTAFISNNGVDVWITAVGLSALAFTLQSVNLIVTISKMRAPGPRLEAPADVQLLGVGLELGDGRRRPRDARGADDALHRPPLQRRLLRPAARAAPRPTTSTSAGSSSPAATCSSSSPRPGRSPRSSRPSRGSPCPRAAPSPPR